MASKQVSWFLCCLLPVVGACSGVKTVGTYKCSDFVDERVYYGRSPEVRRQAIEGFPLEKQYAVFVCARRYVRPPTWDGAESLVAGGPATIGFLKNKLHTLKIDLEINTIIVLIDHMDSTGKYDASQDKDLLQAMDAAVQRMRDAEDRLDAEGRLKRIRGQASTANPE